MLILTQTFQIGRSLHSKGSKESQTGWKRNLTLGTGLKCESFFKSDVASEFQELSGSSEGCSRQVQGICLPTINHC